MYTVLETGRMSVYTTTCDNRARGPRRALTRVWSITCLSLFGVLTRFRSLSSALTRCLSLSSCLQHSHARHVLALFRSQL